MPAFTLPQAEARLLERLAQMRRGDDIVITDGDRPVARLVPFEAGKARRPGAPKGRLALTPEFFEPLPDEELSARGEEGSCCSTLTL